jgi:SAM-dependent methyltransferase
MNDWYNKLETAWSLRSDGYDSIIQKQLRSKYNVRYWRKELSRVLGTKPLKVIDAGCGPGFFSMILLMLGHHVCSVDGAEGMLRHAEENIRSMGFSPDIRLADAVLLENFQPDSFDAIVSRDVVWTLYDPAKAFSRWREVLKNGGKAVIFDGAYFRDYTSPRYHVLKLVSGAIRLIIEPGYKKNNRTIKKENGFEELPMTKHDRPEYDRMLLETAGFSEIEIEPDYYRNTPISVDFWTYGYEGKKFRIVAHKLSNYGEH